MNNKLFAISAAAMVVASASADTVGLWLFNGHSDGETIPSDTVIPNLTVGSRMSMTLVSNAVEGIVNRETIYNTDNLPQPPYIYSDANLTNCLGRIDSAAYFDVKDNGNDEGRKACNFLKVDGFGAAIMKNGVAGDFTVEILCRMPPCNSWQYNNDCHRYANLFGVSPKAALGYASGSPVLCYDDQNGGKLRIYTSDSSSSGAESGWIDNGGSHAQNKGKWTLFVFTYSVSDKTAKVQVRSDVGISSGFVSYTSAQGFGDGIPIDADSFVQFNGPMGAQKYGIPKFYIGAIRVSDKVLREAEWLTVANSAADYAENPIVGWWRFEEGTSGDSFSLCQNSRIGLADPNGVFTRDWVALRHANSGWGDNATGRTNGVSGTYSEVPKERIRPLRRDKEAIRNTACLGSSQCDAFINPLKTYVPMIPDAYLPGSYTIECLVSVPRDASIAANGNARTTLFGFNGNGAWDSVDFKTGILAYKVNRDTGARTLLRADSGVRIEFGKGIWHHLAFVYDRPAADAAKTVMVYLDYNPIQSFSLAANEELQGAILPDGTFSSDFGDATLKQGLPLHLPGSAHLGQLGLWGYVDEVRFTRKALSAEEFLEPCTIRCTVMTFK